MSANYDMHERSFRRAIGFAGVDLVWVEQSHEFRGIVPPCAPVADGVDRNVGDAVQFIITSLVADFPGDLPAGKLFPAQGHTISQKNGAGVYRVCAIDFQPYHPVISFRCTAS